ncbi:hypothetical protein A3E17_00945 [Candidatus Amesbacteria bacterium RIFCSPHIGHO2_12_FULL_48_14]|uniref:Nucleotidyl transferase AbiEii/AbiGii toxin family protein n=2 Tax=Candidatus Amesiibacteriota TaxID=1752730 RepID=A0A1F4ZB56_9BACT|nr:MAG: hypothetical protein UY22_C0025G0007 [Candidatus Amesbacteria bacterium GW2011_GWC1_48_10]OGD03127.1 MAG: hypothetical protein A3E17_00945 [Candidatus Amesbacteria bacterium RIFCSPHIGHO2_12_FULL_48_14]
MQLGHRVSEDFDIFLPTGISPAVRQKALAVIDKLDKVPVDDEHQLTLISRSGLKLTLVSYPYPPLYPLVKSDSLSLFHLADLASNKAYTIGRRGFWRDYIDMYFILHGKIVSLEQITNESQCRFGPEFFPKRFLEQLVFTADLGEMEADFLQDSVSPNEIATFFEKEAKKYTASHLGL